MALLNKKRENKNLDYFTESEEEDSNQNFKIKKDESVGDEKNNKDEDPLPEELIDLINKRKEKGPFKKEDLEKYAKIYNIKYDF